MANHQSAVKRIRQTKRRNDYNRAKKAEIKKAVREVENASSYEEAMEKFKFANKVFDKAAAKNIFHRNYAARRVARLAKQVKDMKQA